MGRESRSVFRCGECGHQSVRWMGFCPQCRAQGSVREVQARTAGGATPIPLHEALASEARRIPVGLSEFDRVLGGGLVPGSVVLIGGEPGVGKSTLLLQVAASVGSRADALVVTAEESLPQIALRARRLGLPADRIFVLAETRVETIVAAIEEHRPAVVVIDSVQTVSTAAAAGGAGGPAQVREATERLVEVSKRLGVATLLVGHVTKDGALAGPKLLEHVVDVVLSFDGDAELGVRVLRGIKNRHGSTHQIGCFEMTGTGLVEVTDPGGLLVDEQTLPLPGTVLFPAVHGRRPLLVEIQALVARTTTPQPRRSVKGLEAARVHQVLAVLERHAGLVLHQHDVYVSVVGGIQVRDPAVDLPVALAVASSLSGRPLGGAAAWGEVDLTGRVRSDPHGE
ncbi:MAG: DNA repair protein RadA, partial [Acidimicrobiia bacterium]